MPSQLSTLIWCTIYGKQHPLVQQFLLFGKPLIEQFNHKLTIAGQIALELRAFYIIRGWSLDKF